MNKQKFVSEFKKAADKFVDKYQPKFDSLRRLTERLSDFYKELYTAYPGPRDRALWTPEEMRLYPKYIELNKKFALSPFDEEVLEIQFNANDVENKAKEFCKTGIPCDNNVISDYLGIVLLDKKHLMSGQRAE